jgi:hypothetical protein
VQELQRLAADEDARATRAGASDEAATLRQRAAGHRAAARALVDKETTACSGVPEQVRDAGPFANQAILDRVIELTDPPTPPGHAIAPGARLLGATIFVRMGPGVSKASLGRSIRCHLARHETLGDALHERLEDPLLVGHPQITIEDRELEFVVQVDITGDDEAEAREILRRARKLRAP